MKNRALILAVALALVFAAWAGWHFLLSASGNRNSSVIAASASHAYQYIAAPDIGWDAAARRRPPSVLAGASRLSGHHRQRRRIPVHRGQHVFPDAYPDVTYLGGRQTAPGEWRWVTGPDGAADGGKGLLFWRGDEQGAVKAARYANWMSTAFQHGGKWDVAKVCCVSIFSYGVPQFSTSLGNGDAEEHVAGYVVEFGG